MIFSFFRRFGGEVSFEQKLVDFGAKLPTWARPAWKLFAEWFIAWMRELKIRAEMKHVDTQVEEIDEQWTQQEDQSYREKVQEVADKLQAQMPTAVVSVVDARVGDCVQPTIFIEEAPDGSKAQDILGGAMEIRNPFVDR